MPAAPKLLTISAWASKMRNLSSTQLRTALNVGKHGTARLPLNQPRALG